jgi:hypothetical protein
VSPSGCRFNRGCWCGSRSICDTGAIRLIGVGATQLRSPVLGPTRIPHPSLIATALVRLASRARTGGHSAERHQSPSGCRFTTRVRLQQRMRP